MCLEPTRLFRFYSSSFFRTSTKISIRCGPAGPRIAHANCVSCQPSGWSSLAAGFHARFWTLYSYLPLKLPRPLSRPSSYIKFPISLPSPPFFENGWAGRETRKTEDLGPVAAHGRTLKAFPRVGTLQMVKTPGPEFWVPSPEP